MDWIRFARRSGGRRWVFIGGQYKFERHKGVFGMVRARGTRGTRFENIFKMKRKKWKIGRELSI